MTLYYVRGVRQNMVKGAARVNDLIGPFDTWSEASRYATAWRALWVQQHAKAHVETPITPCPDTMEWYEGCGVVGDARRAAAAAGCCRFHSTGGNAGLSCGGDEALRHVPERALNLINF